MKEAKRIISLFEKLYDGQPWLDVNIIDSLSAISARQAATRIAKTSNTIWEIVNHMVSWRQNVLKRIQGKVIKTPASNYFETVPDTSEAAWKKTLKKLDDTQQQWIEFLPGLKTTDFEKTYVVNEMTYYEHIHGILQHDAYHLGQIRLLLKSIK